MLSVLKDPRVGGGTLTCKRFRVEWTNCWDRGKVGILETKDTFRWTQGMGEEVPRLTLSGINRFHAWLTLWPTAQVEKLGTSPVGGV